MDQNKKTWHRKRIIGEKLKKHVLLFRTEKSNKNEFDLLGGHEKKKANSSLLTSVCECMCM